MDLSTVQLQAAIEPEPTAAADVVHAASRDHPPYTEMITAAIAGLKEKNGSSKRAIAKFIETQYTNLPPTHSTLLTQNLNQLKNNGQIVMVKHSYTLPRSAPVPVAGNGAVNVPFDLNSVASKRRPGRPPKPKPDNVQNAIPVFVPVGQNSMTTAPLNPPNMAVGPGAVYVSVGPVNGAAPAAGVGAKRGRGRPPKQDGANPGVPRRGRGGRPKVVGAQPSSVGRPYTSSAAGRKGSGRPRGRPPKSKDVLAGVAPPAPAVGMLDPVAVGLPSGGTLPVAADGVSLAKRRGRPPKAGGETTKPRKPPTREPKKPRRPSGKPVGRPRKNPSATAIQIPYSEEVTQDLKGKLAYLQSRIRHTVNTIKPCLNGETAVAALLELEMLSTMDVDALPNVQNQQPQ
ncbi:histone H1-like [Olea europaea subsp. europaea]|uniref:Histone H1-like n=1 Tax=Olea europaea subsp. europaea TaxID=158383 RepID=A0A8S0PS08_OLEEU|nr:histone H1-like [Olea europaea subsp. europaea]